MNENNLRSIKVEKLIKNVEFKLFTSLLNLLEYDQIIIQS